MKEADCLDNCTRIRKPRAFYRTMKAIKEYNDLDSKLYQTLKQKGWSHGAFFYA